MRIPFYVLTLQTKKCVFILLTFVTYFHRKNYRSQAQTKIIFWQVGHWLCTISNLQHLNFNLKMKVNHKKCDYFLDKFGKKAFLLHQYRKIIWMFAVYLPQLQRVEVVTSFSSITKKIDHRVVSITSNYCWIQCIWILWCDAIHSLLWYWCIQK